MKFNEQVVIVTGGTRGIGRAITENFLAEGATVIATYAGNTEKAEAFYKEINSENLHLYKFNVADYTACENFFNEITEKFSQIHVLVNNAGIRKDNLTATMSEDDWSQVLDINLKGSFNMSKLAVLSMMRKRYGRIINISSIGGSIGLPGQANYAASKAGQIAMSKSLSKEVAKRKITVNNVLPGFIETELVADLNEELVKSYTTQVPMKRFGTGKEVASAVMFLASEEASYITGTSIEVSGGL